MFILAIQLNAKIMKIFHCVKIFIMRNLISVSFKAILI